MSQAPSVQGDTCPAHAYPATRESPLHPPALLGELRDGPAASRVRLWDGSVVWLVTRHAEARSVLGDQRFTAVTSAPGFPMLTRTSTLVRAQPRTASFIRMDNPEHSRLRSMLTREFLPRATEAHRPTVRALLDSVLEPLSAGGGPVDLVELVAVPVPARVIAAVLAVPEQDTDFFVSRSAVLIDRSFTPDQVISAREELDAYLHSLAEQRRRTPGDDLVSRLVHDRVVPGELAMADLVPMVRLLLVAGHGTTASQASLSLLSMLTDDTVRARCDDPATVGAAVEELLRFHSIVQNGLARAATEDVDLGDVVIRRGEGVVVSLAAANRDPAAFPEPDALDPTRDARRHLAFGHGTHQCLGQWLAKIELEEILGAVLRWMPRAALAVPPAQVGFRPDVSSYGVDALPVTW